MTAKIVHRHPVSSTRDCGGGDYYIGGDLHAQSLRLFGERQPEEGKNRATL